MIRNKYHDLFPILEYLNKYYPDGKLNSTNNYTATCPMCKKYKFSWHITKLKGLCPKCLAAGENAAFSSIESLIVFTENIPFVSAMEKVKALAVGSGDIDSFGIEIKLLKNRINKDVNIADIDFVIHEPIPYKTKVDVGAVKKYFSKRKRKVPIEILEVFPAYFSSAPFLNNRLVFEVTTNDNAAWIARYIGKKKDIEGHRKTLNPSGSVLSNMLFGYNLFKNDDGPLLLTEGIFDTIRCALRGYGAVSSFGCNLSAAQVSLLNDTNASEIVLCYDADKAGMKGMWKIIRKWRKHINKNVSMVIMPYGEDADSCSSVMFRNAFNNRRKFY